jgi:hypothetical protein
VQIYQFFLVVAIAKETIYKRLHIEAGIDSIRFFLYFCPTQNQDMTF